MHHSGQFGDGGILALGWKTEFPTLSLHLNVNLSCMRFNRRGYVGQVCETLRQTSVLANELQMEITEFVL